jgi:hypothetical protein
MNARRSMRILPTRLRSDKLIRLVWRFLHAQVVIGIARWKHNRRAHNQSNPFQRRADVHDHAGPRPDYSQRHRRSA